MDSEPHPRTGSPAIEDNQAPPSAAHPQDRSTDRPAHTPRGARSGDHPSRLGALPPAPGRLPGALASPAVPAVLLVLLVAVSWQVAADGPLLTLDHHVRDAVLHARHALRSPPVNQLGQLLSDLGGGMPAVPVLLGVGALATGLGHRKGLRRWWLPLPVAALAAVLVPLLVVPAKVYFARPGPAGLPFTPGQWGWYPSGHTTTAGISYGTAALLLGRALAAAARRWLHRATVLLCLGVGLGLLWCDYHWLLDVLAGWCLTGLALWCLARWLPDTRRRGHP